jgi:hypothetical protein
MKACLIHGENGLPCGRRTKYGIEMLGVGYVPACVQHRRLFAEFCRRNGMADSARAGKNVGEPIEPGDWNHVSHSRRTVDSRRAF